MKSAATKLFMPTAFLAHLRNISYLAYCSPESLRESNRLSKLWVNKRGFKRTVSLPNTFGRKRTCPDLHREPVNTLQNLVYLHTAT
ncbi:MAG: hypothetical protein U5L45_02975 [Saprospiraceae bacterium]|nr:hypothetical protein [Saprospiraceae bacterium]